MNDTSKVALLVDFENLVFGLEAMHGEDYAQHVEPEVLIRLAEEYGQVVLANAYADWRSRDANQFQTDLYRLGIDLVHVFAKRQQGRIKNAVDVKMAVDAVETVWTLPHIETFVIVSGDRDFIHVLKALRRYGKTVVGVSPDQSVSEDFASLCDRFVRYGALLSSYASSGGSHPPTQTDSGEQSLTSVRAALRDILAERPEGVKGAQIKPLLRRRLSATFDESEYGFARLGDLLRALPEVVEVMTGVQGGDITVRLVGAAVSSEVDTPPSAQASRGDESSADPAHALIKEAELSAYGFESDPDKRRRVLSMLFVAMKVEEPFALEDVFERVLQDSESLGLTTSRLSRYQSILWQSRCFIVEPEQQDRPVRQRSMRLQSQIVSDEDLIVRYESSVVYKLGVAATAKGEELTTSLVCRVLGLPETPDTIAYCRKLLVRVG